MMRVIRKSAKDFTAVVMLLVIATVVGGYILTNQRLRFPFIDEEPFKVKAEFSTAQAVAPGQGQTVRISGVRVGDIAKVDLEDGRAIVTMDIDQEHKDLIREDATGLLRPKTGLKDMFIDLNPGSLKARRVKENFTIPVQNTLPDVNPDEIFAALDEDTRGYLQLLVNGAGDGLRERGGDLQEVFERFEPTHRDLARVTSAVASRERNLRRLINSLARLNGELAGRDDDVAQLVDSSAVVFRAFASEEANISRSVRALPGALRQTTTTLGKVERFADVLAPTADKLRPAVRALDDANKAIQPFAKEAAPIIQNRIRPFVREIRPLVRDLRPATANLSKATPDLTRSFVVLNHLFNLLSFNEDGTEPPSDASRKESYLFWLAWLGHQANTLFSSGDANSSFRPVTLGATCPTLAEVGHEYPPVELLLAPITANPAICPPP